MLFVKSIMNSVNERVLRSALPRLGGRCHPRIAVMGKRGTTNNENVARGVCGRFLRANISIVAVKGRA